MSTQGPRGLTGARTMQMRHESGEVLVFDDPLALSRCHMLAVPMSAYVPDVAALFAAPAAGLRLIEALDAAAWGEVRRMVGPGGDEGWRRSVLSAEGLEMDETELRGCVAAGFNMPPSQYQLHIQYIFPPLLPQHWLSCGTACTSRDSGSSPSRTSGKRWRGWGTRRCVAASSRRPPTRAPVR